MKEFGAIMVALIGGMALGVGAAATLMPSPEDPVCIAFDPANGECTKTTTREQLIDEARERESAK